MQHHLHLPLCPGAIHTHALINNIFTSDKNVFNHDRRYNKIYRIFPANFALSPMLW